MKYSSLQKQKAVFIVCFLFVPLLFLFLFTYLPLGDMVRLSFFKWDGISKKKEFLGVKNYIEVFSRPEYFSVLKVSLYYFAGSVIQIALALLLAVIFSKKLRFVNMFKGIIFFPYLINGVAISFIFLYFYKAGGTLDTILVKMGFEQDKLPLWLGDPNIVNISLVFVSVWRYIGQNVVMFSGAIQSIDTQIFEASMIDGASEWQQFKYITFPSIKPIISLNLILAVKGAINVFEIPYIMTGGASGSATFVTKTIETAFKLKKIGLASSMGVVLLTLIMLVTFVQEWVFKRGEKNEH